MKRVFSLYLISSYDQNKPEEFVGLDNRYIHTPRQKNYNRYVIPYVADPGL